MHKQLTTIEFENRQFEYSGHWTFDIEFKLREEYCDAMEGSGPWWE